MRQEARYAAPDTKHSLHARVDIPLMQVDRTKGPSVEGVKAYPPRGRLVNLHRDLTRANLMLTAGPRYAAARSLAFVGAQSRFCQCSELGKIQVSTPA